MTEIANKKWECSFTSYPELRFHEDRIEVLASDEQITSTLIKLAHVEPGLIRVDYKSGAMLFFVFGDDLQSFVIASADTAHEFTVAGASAPVRFSAKPMDLRYTDHPHWQGSRSHPDKFEILDEAGAVYATNLAVRYDDHAQGVLLPEKRYGLAVLSRQKPGGWFLAGKNQGVGVRTEKSGYFRTFLASKLQGYALRSAHFNYVLLNAGMPEFAEAQERMATQLTINTYGESSEQLGACWNEMGTLRGYARSYAKAPEYHQRALDHAKKHFGSDQAKLLDYGIDLAASQNDSGNFAGAKHTLAEAYPLLAKDGGDFRGTYLFHQQLGMSAFGLREYGEAARLFLENAQRAEAAKATGNVLESFLSVIPCQMMQNQPALALAALNQGIAAQEKWSKANPSYNFDTWKLAFACVALGKNEEALQYAPTRQRRNWVAYEEYGRMVALFHGGDRAGAQSLAQEFIGRFASIQEINVRDDIDPVTVKLTLAIAKQTPEAVAALEQVWAEQVVSLKSRPLKNYIFAKVMVATLAKLKEKR